MSSILYVEVMGKQDHTLSLLLVEIQWGFVFKPSPTLALNLLVESQQMMRLGRVATDLEAESQGGLYCPFPVEEAQARAAASPIATINPDLGDEAWFAENASRYVMSTSIDDVRYTAGLRGALEPVPHLFAPKAQCEFRVQVADARWLDHLEAGVCWDTTAYPYE